MKTESTLQLSAYNDNDVKNLFTEIIKFSKKYDEVQLVTFTQNTHDDIIVYVELHGVNKDD